MGRVKTLRDHAIVLRTHKLGEADRIITLLTREHGRRRAVAKGVRRTSSKFGSRLEPFMQIDVQLWQGRSLDVVTQAVTLAPLARSIAPDYTRYTAGSAMLEVAERLTPQEGEPARQQYLLLAGAVRTLAQGSYEPGLVLDAFLLRSMAVGGWTPALSGCARCGRPGPHRAFVVVEGGVVCEECRPAGAAQPAPGTLTLMAALLSGDWDVAVSSALEHRREAARLTAEYAQWHLEHALRSLRLVEAP